MTSEQTKRLRAVRVYFDDGDSLLTEINGTVEQIEQYFLNKTFNIGCAEDKMKKCTRIEFLEDE